MAGTFGKRTAGFGAPHPGMAAPPAAPAIDREPVQDFEYRPDAAKTLLFTMLMGAFAVFAAYTALDNDRGLLIDHIIRLDTGQATVFWWGMALLAGGAFLFALYSLVLAVSPPRMVILDATGITAPRTIFTTETARVGYTAITDLRIVTVKRHRTLHIRHVGGNLAITESVMGGAFDALIDALATRVAQRR